jgi:hypothetical protein
MSQPDGFIVDGNQNWSCKIKKSLYSLKQFPSSGTRDLTAS